MSDRSKKEMISENTIRSEKFNNEYFRLKDIIQKIPMTAEQRNEAEQVLEEMDRIFVEANKEKNG